MKAIQPITTLLLLFLFISCEEDKVSQDPEIQQISLVNCECERTDNPTFCDLVCSDQNTTFATATVIRGRGCEIGADCFPNPPALQDLVFIIPNAEFNSTVVQIVNDNGAVYANTDLQNGGYIEYDEESNSVEAGLGWVDGYPREEILTLKVSSVVTLQDETTHNLQYEKELGVGFFSE
ncbi:hypothetical protein OO013_15900 [Mangrovivirga sp. M17]|uniref:Uncharacterized protein n=1 Tax=Mangrovivirga halotolerans TaxID=2993936 RepID=A0ABT3RUW4_9BACT|nr:hypothetical protein [Mangrovivirga halotolerans]MCX2745362.1 hypothetical protein [Mangrovivirga halotolerans]